MSEINPYHPDQKNPTASLFFDREEGHFKGWLGAVGLPEDAPDDMVAAAMTDYLKEHDTNGIRNYRDEMGLVDRPVLHR